MTRLRLFVKKIKLAALTVLCWLAVYAPVLAQAKPEEKAKGKGASWLLSYALVLMCVALGMLVVCRSSRRRERAQQEMFSDSDDEQEE